MDGSHLNVLGAGDRVQVFGPDSFVPGQLGAGSSDYAEGASVFLTLDLPHYGQLEELGGSETKPLGREPSAGAEPGSSQDVFGEGLQSKIRAP